MMVPFFNWNSKEFIFRFIDGVGTLVNFLYVFLYLRRLFIWALSITTVARLLSAGKTRMRSSSCRILMTWHS